ncbi:MAG: hypothetical protein P8X57_02035 [Cyclobacteriaceae bacterium]
MENINVLTTKKIRLRRALILGNFYGQNVQIHKESESGSETIIDMIIGIRPEGIITKGGRNIALHNIRSIYQL